MTDIRPSPCDCLLNSGLVVKVRGASERRTRESRDIPYTCGIVVANWNRDLHVIKQLDLSLNPEGKK